LIEKGGEIVFDLKLIKPKKKGESDKYSYNLYKLLSNLDKEKLLHQTKIYWLHHSRWDGEHLPFDPKNLNIRQLILTPYDTHSVGYFMDSVLHKGTKAERYALPYKKEKMMDITQWFIDTYAKIGRCIFDYKHIGWFYGDENRYKNINENHKECNWCGQLLKKRVEKEVKVVQHTYWDLVTQ
jgi:hypothetical protein